MNLKNGEHEKQIRQGKANETKTICTQRKLKILWVRHAFDCYGAFIKLHRINAFSKFELNFDPNLTTIKPPLRTKSSQNSKKYSNYKSTTQSTTHPLSKSNHNQTTSQNRELSKFQKMFKQNSTFLTRLHSLYPNLTTIKPPLRTMSSQNSKKYLNYKSTTQSTTHPLSKSNHNQTTSQNRELSKFQKMFKQNSTFLTGLHSLYPNLTTIQPSHETESSQNSKNVQTKIHLPTPLQTFYSNLTTIKPPLETESCQNYIN